MPGRVLATLALVVLAACGNGALPRQRPPALPPETGACLGAGLLTALGKDHLLVGMSSGRDAAGDAAAAAAPYDLRYLYLAGGLAPGDGPCASCTAPGCGTWWGCWQWDQLPPGDYARRFLADAAGDRQLPMFTYYELLQASGVPEGDAEVTVASDRAFMARYLSDWRFLLQQVGSAAAFLHVEPDFWGYAAQRGVPCSAIPAAVASASADCAGLPETLAGLGRCLIDMARAYAPNAKVGLHASGWGTRIDVLMNASPALDVAAEGRRLGAFLLGCGAGDGDFVAADMSDRDAGTNGRWWDPTNAALPDFHQAFAWGGAVAEAVGRPLLWWQTPVGNMALPPANQDNRLDYVFDHFAELSASHALGIAFGAGAAGQASPETDGGHLAARTQAYAAAGGVAPCR